MTWDPAAYDRIRAGCQASAAVIVPLLDRWFHPRSVIDVGAGQGWFANEFVQRGCQVLAIDHPIPDPRAADVRFADVDLTKPLPSLGPFDLAVCLEVAEHLPATAAESLVEGLTRLAPVVAFSAAIPGQTGLGHVNCQWPAYWARMFEDRGYTASGALRYELWNDPRVEPWYSQNLLAFIDPSEGELASLALFNGYPETLALPLVHPDIYSWKL